MHEPEVGAFGGSYRPHPLAELFPLIEGQAYWDLVADIREHGVREPVVMLDGMVLDGRNRYLAAREAGRPIPAVQYEGDDPAAYVISLNLKRRHLNDAQRAMVAAKLAKLPHGGNRQPDQAANWRDAPTTIEAARLLNVPPRSVERARAVQDDGAPALVASVEAGAISVAAAAEVAKLPETLQAEIVEEGPAAVREAASELRAGADPEHVRQVVIEGARAGLRPERRPAAKNPDYKPNPAFDAMSALTGSCRRINEVVAERGLDTVIAGFFDAAMLARNLPDIRACRDNLNALLERCDAEQAAA